MPESDDLAQYGIKQPTMPAQAPEPVPSLNPTQTPENPANGQINVFNPKGELVSIPKVQLGAAMEEGYRQASDEAISKHLAEQKYGGTGQQVLAGIEGVAQGVAGPLATGAELALGVPEEDIRGREEANPATNMIGQGAGLVGGAFIGTTEARGLMTLPKVAELAAAKFVPEAATTIGKIGSSAAKAAIENMVIQGSNEVSKMMLHDPTQSTETALVDVGLAGLIGGGIGGAIGSVSPLWNATLGKKTEGALKAISDKLGGIEGVDQSALNKSIAAAGMDDMAPEIRAAMSSDPLIQQQAQILGDAATHSGIKYQEALKDFKINIGDKMLEAVGKTRDDVAGLENLNPREAGERIKTSIKDKIEAAYEPISKSYNEISAKFKDTILPPIMRAELTDNLAKLISEGVSTESAEAKLVQRVVKEVGGIQNLEQLRNYSTALGRETSGIAKQELWDIGSKLRSAFSNAEEKALNFAVEKGAPELLEKHVQTNASYKGIKNLIGDLNDRLKVGPHAGVKTFLKNLGEMDGEAVLSRLNPSNKAAIIEELSKNFPEVAQEVKDYHLGKILKTAAKFPEAGHAIAPKSLFKQLDGLSPQMREFLVNPEQAAKIQGLKALLDKLPEKVGKSGTPQGLDGLMQHVPGTATGLATVLLGHGALAGGVVGYLTKALGRDIPDAVRLGLLKFLGSSKEIEPGAFKSFVDYAHSVIKGEKLVNDATKNVFKAGREVLPQALIPTSIQKDKLDKQLGKLKADQSSLLNVGGKTSHYAPEHGQAMGTTAINAVNYLNGLKPSNDKQAPLDSHQPLNPTQKAAYDRALSVAQQPLMVLDRLQKGTLVPQDIAALKTMYPALYTKFVNQLTAHMTDALAKGEKIPYTTRLGLSMFMAQPLDSTMTPQGIVAAQMIPTSQAAQQQQSNGGGAPPHAAKSQTSSLNKLAQQYQTPAQNRIADRQKH